MIKLELLVILPPLARGGGDETSEGDGEVVKKVITKKDQNKNN